MKVRNKEKQKEEKKKKKERRWEIEDGKWEEQF